MVYCFYAPRSLSGTSVYSFGCSCMQPTRMLKSLFYRLCIVCSMCVFVCVGNILLQKANNHFSYKIWWYVMQKKKKQKSMYRVWSVSRFAHRYYVKTPHEIHLKTGSCYNSLGREQITGCDRTECCSVGSDDPPQRFSSSIKRQSKQVSLLTQ